MKIPSDEIPQADNLWDVAKVAECVALGAKTYQEIAAGIGKVERQGRYYRKAAEIIGFIAPIGPNHSQLTVLGAKWVAANTIDKKAILIQAALGCKILQRVIPFLESRPNGTSREEILAFLDNVADLGGSSMAPRRVSTILHWLNDCSVIAESGGKYSLKRLPDSVPFLDYSQNESEPLLPKSWALTDYESHALNYKSRTGVTTVLIDQAKHEKANQSHRELVDLVASRAKNAGSVPKVGKLIDLAASFNGADYIFEMKSLSGENARSQVRQGISQLYEYRYIEQSKNAKLVLVIQNKLEDDVEWMNDYIIEDRNISLLWDGDGNLYCPSKLKEEFGFLQPIAV